MKKTAFNKKDIIKTMTYVDALQQGLVDYEDIDDFIDEWHESDGAKTISQFLGMTLEQYKVYFKENENGLRKMFKRGISK